MREALLVGVAFAVVGCGGLARTGAAPPTDPTHDTVSLETLGWLIGRWQTDDSAVIEEWTRESGRLVGTSYSQRFPDCAAPDHGEEAACGAHWAVTESLEVIERDGRLIYIASPVGQTRTEFTLTEVDGAHFVAENAAHDFPTRIEYQRVQERIDVRVSSPVRGFELHFQRLDTETHELPPS
jgi:hypothetical protein